VAKLNNFLGIAELAQIENPFKFAERSNVSDVSSRLCLRSIRIN
jgi:hypothetical protein